MTVSKRGSLQARARDAGKSHACSTLLACAERGAERWRENRRLPVHCQGGQYSHGALSLCLGTPTPRTCARSQADTSTACSGRCGSSAFTRSWSEPRMANT